MSDNPSERSPSSQGDASGRFAAIGDVKVKLTVVVGKTRLSVKSLLELEPGDLLRLDRREGDPVDILVNDRLIARGRLVQRDEGLGVCVAEIVADPLDDPASPKDGARTSIQTPISSSP